MGNVRGNPSHLHHRTSLLGFELHSAGSKTSAPLVEKTRRAAVFSSGQENKGHNWRFLEPRRHPRPLHPNSDNC